ncbi:MAG: type II toxin-antitoxin system RelE/ParE family toxin [Roseiarcus sp.]
MRVFKLKAFAKFQRREQLTDAALSKAVRDAEKGLVAADLGGGLIKQRIARPGRGKSGGYRTIIAYHRGERAVFLFGFAKSAFENIDDDELEVLRAYGRAIMQLSEAMLLDAAAHGEMMELDYD